MTAEELIAEGRRLQRPCSFLRSAQNGEIAAVWLSAESDESDFRPWLSVDTRFIPGFDTKSANFLTILANQNDCVSGRVDIVSALPAGEALYAHPTPVLPPLDAVFACGSAAVEHWLQTNGWDRITPYNDNFPDQKVVRDYERLWMEEFPLYLQDNDIYAVLGGWHFPFPDGDWHQLAQQRLLAMTIRDSEPWVEAWQVREGEYQVIQRCT